MGSLSVLGSLSPGEQEWHVFMGTAETAHGYKRALKVPLRAVIVHTFKSLKLHHSCPGQLGHMLVKCLSLPAWRDFRCRYFRGQRGKVHFTNIIKTK